MSEGYASRLKDYPDKGVCGLPENRDTKRSLTVKLNKLAAMVRESTHFVILTGAGISTSAGIPDFRGPQGIWTVEKEKEKEKKKKANSSKQSLKRKREPVVMDFAAAQPTLTHRAIAKLASLGILKFCVTQNVDGLHCRSGLSRGHHSVLHGCVFTEKCSDCGMEHFRDFDCGGMSFQKTGRKCEKCQGDLCDTLLDWEDALPEDDFERATDECEKADLALCLGTSLRIEPAGSLPTLAKKYVIVNLQETPKDQEAAMVIRSRVDEVMNNLLEQLGHPDWDDGDPAPIERLWKMPTALDTK
jgi:mono-ADP-ribosyltransferase sirtuin 6